MRKPSPTGAASLRDHLPDELRAFEGARKDIPRIAKDETLVRLIKQTVRSIPTRHDLRNHDSRGMRELPPGSVHLVVTSPPYWTLKEYRSTAGQLGRVPDYEEFLGELDKVWRSCFEALVPGGRLVCVGDVCLSRRKNGGRHTVVPLHAAIQERCRAIGYDNLATIIWHKIANARHEAGAGGTGYLGKPYEPNSIVKNDIEFVLMERKPGGYRQPDAAARILSVIPADCHREWFRQVWTGLPGASTRHHPAPYPLELATLPQQDRFVRLQHQLVIPPPPLSTGPEPIC